MSSPPPRVVAADLRAKAVFNPPQQHRESNDSNSATSLIRTKQPSSNKQIVQLFQTLLSVFGAGSGLGSQLSASSFGDVHLNRFIDSYAASTLMKYLSAVGNFIRSCKELGISFLDISALQLADILITVQMSKSSDTSGCSSTGTLKALRWWQKVAGIESWKPILFAPVIQSFLTIKIPSDRSESVPIPLWCIVQWEKRVLTSACGPEIFRLRIGESQRHLMENENHPPGTSVWAHSSGTAVFIGFTIRCSFDSTIIRYCHIFIHRFCLLILSLPKREGVRSRLETLWKERSFGVPLCISVDQKKQTKIQDFRFAQIVDSCSPQCNIFRTRSCNESLNLQCYDSRSTFIFAFLPDSWRV